ncbi:MAG: AAA family ATPase [Spirochaetaceae bacterium]|jgi:MoxR-like ATPase|nr:AAA family ATPase [Spirochaetaceae bacterium]
MSVKSKIQGILKDLKKGIYEKDAAIALSLLSSVAGESVFLLGPPGVAKSLIARRLKYAYKDSRAFEYLMSQFSTPDEIFGPVSISKLKDEDKYERVTEHYLPGASVVFLDEIWKAGPSIQNALLTVLNERVYRNGEQEILLPMKALIAASNELPAKGQGLEALWDRFLLRIPVENITDMGHFRAMISAEGGLDTDPVRERHKITEPEYRKWREKINRVAIPEEVFNLMALIKTQYIPAHNQREERAGAPLYISDRRWKKIARLLRASAFLNGRNAVDLMDCFLIRHCLWHEKEDQAAAARFVEEAARQYGCAAGFDAQGFREEIALFRHEITEVSQTVQDTREAALKIFGKAYCRFPPNRYIKKTDLAEFTSADKTVTLYEKRDLSTGYLGRNRPHMAAGTFSMTVDGAESDLETMFVPAGSAAARTGNGLFTVIIDNTEQPLETIIAGNRRRITKKPPRKTIAVWEKRAAALIDALDQWKAGIKAQERAGGTDNFFVEPKQALVLRSRFESAAREIENLELEVREIQYRYRHIQDEETILA